ncbi:4-diphosphocytidyl-2-C-methyl-D-erythritol kinase [hydrothermal vent metagenome]|uniref:4-diphosphocytidyl-2-C-methyl-D-erythritol kinase n=1 Tax=hydrothermal vent metagenome TaxID=652676 RepID=A0A3B0WJK3_9ZZZZ
MDMVTTRLLSPAKINLMLRIIGQRADGYHLLQTCFQLLDWGDEITFNPVKTDGSNHIEITGFDDLDVKDNLIYQAAEMLKPWAQLNSDWLIKVDKQIPLGAGLGGGSSNAATALKFFNQAWQCDLSVFDLLALAAKLGADVPVFILEQSTLAGGIGDVLTPMKFDTPHILLLFPDCHINTAELFQTPDLVRDQSTIKSISLQQPSFWINDFMPVVLLQFSQVDYIYQRLKTKMNLRLSGSGSTLFAVFNELNSAQRAHKIAEEVCMARLVQPQL